MKGRERKVTTGGFVCRFCFAKNYLASALVGASGSPSAALDREVPLSGKPGFLSTSSYNDTDFGFEASSYFIEVKVPIAVYNN